MWWRSAVVAGAGTAALALPGHQLYCSCLPGGTACSTGVAVCAQTNNPRKIAVLEELGVVVTERIPCLVQAQEHSLGYLTTKQVPCALVPPARRMMTLLGTGTCIRMGCAECTACHAPGPKGRRLLLGVHCRDISSQECCVSSL